MNYCIKNNKNVYIKLNNNGCAVTCGEDIKGVFEYSKAKNILESLPKTLKRMNFRVEAIPEINIPIESKEEIKQMKVLENQTYVVSEDINRWVDKFGTCSDVLEEARNRKSELIEALNNVDKEFIDILHIIEIEKSKDMYGGWKEYKHIKDNREKRRKIKDELLIIQSLLKGIDCERFRRERVRKSVDGLLNRKYTFRIIDEEREEDEVM